MNKNIKLAVAGAVLALSATAANAGIVIPAGEWTLDVSGNVNTFATWSKNSGGATVAGGLVGAFGQGQASTTSNMTTGLLPNFLSFTGTTRQNDLDVSWTISIQPGSSNTSSVAGGTQNNRQAFLTFGDKSWGSIKVGKDLGLFGSDAILSDITLLGVGAPTAAGGNTTLGRIGSGYIYADWIPQITYTTPNFSGFQASAGLTQNWGANSFANSVDTAAVVSNTTTVTAATTGALYSAVTTNRAATPSYQGKASYAFNANGVDGKVWVSGVANKVSNLGGVAVEDSVAYAGDIGANLNAYGFGLTGYYYSGSGVGTTGLMRDGYSTTGKTRDSDGGYVQLTYVLPTKTKIAASWGESNLDRASNETTATNLVKRNEQWNAGIYHPLTKHLNLVAEYNYVNSEAQNGKENKNYSGSLGAILFF